MGTPFDKGMVFTGGSEVRIEADSSVIDNPEEEIRKAFGDKEPESIRNIPSTDGLIVNFAKNQITPDEIEQSIGDVNGLTLSELSQVSPSIGSSAQITALYGLLSAFVLMSLLVILLFRSVIPAVVIILSAVSNMLIAGAAMNLAGIQLSMGTVGAVLMLIGYSVDSDILLNRYILLGNSGTFNERVHDAMRTGVTMTITSLSAMVVMFIVSTVFGIQLLADMGFVLSIGLMADLLNTYMMNVSILRWYANRRDII